MFGKIFWRRSDARSLLGQKLQFCKRPSHNPPFLSDSSWYHVRKHSCDRIVIYAIYLHGISINSSNFSMYSFADAVSAAGSFFWELWDSMTKKTLQDSSAVRNPECRQSKSLAEMVWNPDKMPWWCRVFILGYLLHERADTSLGIARFRKNINYGEEGWVMWPHAWIFCSVSRHKYVDSLIFGGSQCPWILFEAVNVDSETSCYAHLRYSSTSCTCFK